MAFRDPRNQAELLLAPKLPVSRSVVNFSSLRLNLGGLSLPGVISGAAQISGPVRMSLAGSLATKTLTEGLAGSINVVLGGFDAQASALRNGTFIPPDPMLVTPHLGVPNVAAFFSFSSLHPGGAIPASFALTIQNRKLQLQALSKNFSASFSKSSFGGVSIVENTNPSTYPLADQLDLPSLPRLAQGGVTARADAIYKDKVRFTVKGVNIGSGKPSFWSRLLGAAAIAAPMLNPVVNQLFRDRKHQSTWSEPVTPYAAQFPYNRVQQSASGHVIEIDDTPGAERVHIFHRSGSFIEFHPDGSVVYKNMKDGYLITMNDQFVKVNGKCHVAVDGGVTIYSKGNIDVQADGDINVQTKGDYNVYAKNINLRAKKTAKLDGIIVDMRYLTLPTSIMPVFAGIAPVGFAPRINIAAALEAFPGGNFDMGSFTPSMDPNSGGIPAIVPGDPQPPPPPENPLSNFSIYQAVAPAAIAYRAHLFDTPEETNDFEMYSAHTGLQQTLGDVVGTERALGGSLRTIDTGLVAPDTKPTVNYLNYNDFKGTYDYATTYALGNTSFTLADVADVALHADFVADTALTDFTEGVPEDTTNLTAASNTTGSGGDQPNSDGGPADNQQV
jgi:hypothetical protein